MKSKLKYLIITICAIMINVQVCYASSLNIVNDEKELLWPSKTVVRELNFYNQYDKNIVSNEMNITIDLRDENNNEIPKDSDIYCALIKNSILRLESTDGTLIEQELYKILENNIKINDLTIMPQDTLNIKLYLELDKNVGNEVQGLQVNIEAKLNNIYIGDEIEKPSEDNDEDDKEPTININTTTNKDTLVNTGAVVSSIFYIIGSGVLVGAGYILFKKKK